MGAGIDQQTSIDLLQSYAGRFPRPPTVGLQPLSSLLDHEKFIKKMHYYSAQIKGTGHYEFVMNVSVRLSDC